MMNNKEPAVFQKLIAKKKAEDTEWKVNALQLVDIFRSMSYTLGESVADVIDNSIDIGASEVDVYYEFDREKEKRYLIVADNGSGMDEGTLDRSMDIGAVKERNRMDLGKFGIGLKLSSLSQAKDITVITKTKNDNPVCRRISYEHIKRTNDLRLLKTISPNSHYEHAEELLKNFDTGTVILWEEMDNKKLKFNLNRVRASFANEKIVLADFLSLTFHRYLSGKTQNSRKIRISLNDQPLAPLDPLLEDFQGIENYGTIIETVFLSYFNEPIKVKLCVHPNMDRIEDKELLQRLFRVLFSPQKAQGIYFYRNDRLITKGGWHYIKDLVPHASKNLLRVAIDVPTQFDDEFRLNPTKTDYDSPDEFKNLLSEELYKKRDGKWEVQGFKRNFFEKGQHRARYESPKRTHEEGTKSEKKPKIHHPTYKDKKEEKDKGVLPPASTEVKKGLEKTVELRATDMPLNTELLWTYKKGNVTEVVFNKGHALYDKLISVLKKDIHNIE